MKSILSCLYIIILLALPVGRVVNAVEVKWTANTDGKNDPAATAPKSQKYWDEHNIERPDYAKTDAEVLAEQLGGGRNLLSILIFLLATAAIVYLVVWPRIVHGKGQTLGSSTSSSASPFSFGASDPSVARQARLSRFETSKNDKQE